MLEIVLVEPEIPPNTGNVIRLCANTGCRLHLVRPFGFLLGDKQLKRASMDYRGLVDIVQHADWAACRAALHGRRLFGVTTRADQRHDAPSYADGDIFVFGAETRGLSVEILSEFPPQQRIRIPMQETSRSLNLSNAVAVVIYEAWRQLGFGGGG